MLEIACILAFPDKNSEHFGHKKSSDKEGHSRLSLFCGRDSNTHHNFWIALCCSLKHPKQTIIPWIVVNYP